MGRWPRCRNFTSARIWQSHMKLFLLCHCTFCRWDTCPRCPFGCQCPVNSSVKFLNWFLFCSNPSLILLMENSQMKTFTLFFIQVQTSSILGGLCASSPWRPTWPATLSVMPHAASGSLSGYPDKVLAKWSASLFPSIPLCPASHISCILACTSV